MRLESRPSEEPERCLAEAGELGEVIGEHLRGDALLGEQVADLTRPGLGQDADESGAEPESRRTKRLRGPVDAGYQRTMIAGLALLAAGLPHNVPLTDPQTGNRFCVQRRRGFLTLVVGEPVAEVGEELTTVRRYLLALLGVPSH